MRIDLPVRMSKIEALYNFLVQIDYLAGLCVAFTLGAEKWFLFSMLLVASLVLGIITVYVYIKMMKRIVKSGTDR